LWQLLVGEQTLKPLWIDGPEVSDLSVNEQHWNLFMMLCQQIRILIYVYLRKFHIQPARHFCHCLPSGVTKVAVFSNQQLNLMQSTHLSIISRAVTTLEL